MIFGDERVSVTPSGLGFEDMNCNLMAISKQPKGILKEIKQVIEMARDFNDKVVRPSALEIDKKIQQDPEYLPWEWVDKAAEYGFYTLWIPKLFGGKGYSFASLVYFTEEISSCCVGMANVIGVHYVGFATLMATWNGTIIRKLCAEMIEGEKNRSPCLIDIVITEPGIGTDTPQADLIDKGNPSCHATKTEGGYLINGTKIFISNGHYSTWHIVLAYEDLDNPADSSLFFVVRKGTKGFSTGRKEMKMGQKACPASELIFHNCFIPNELICLNSEQTNEFSTPHREIYQMIFDSLGSVSRSGLCAVGAGVARNVYEEVLHYAMNTKSNNSWLINYEWVQCRLADMFMNIATSRLLYAEVNFANGLYGMNSVIQNKFAYYFLKYLPTFLVDRISGVLMRQKFFLRLLRKMNFDWKKPEHLERTTAWSSLSKFAGSDAAVKNCQLGIEIMGNEGLRHENKIEKCLRDAKLLQIYEGTNQLTRLELFKNFIGRNISQVKMFEDN